MKEELMLYVVKLKCLLKKILLPNNAHKIIILDEADSMTCSAMQAMRRTMEQYAQTTRFVFVCNDSTKIIEPIQSRCSMIRYTKLNKHDIIKKLKIYVKMKI